MYCVIIFVILRTILLIVASLLAEPNPRSAANVEAAQLYVKFVNEGDPTYLEIIKYVVNACSMYIYVFYIFLMQESH